MTEQELSAEQQALLASIRSGPRGAGTTIRGPFAVFLQAPAFGELAQQLGGYCRYKTTLPPRLSEFAILATAKLWRAQYEWFAHVPMAERAGVKKETIRELHRGLPLKSATAEEKVIYDFVNELYEKKRVSDMNFACAYALLGTKGTIELVGILGYYALISMILNVFRVALPEGEPLPFAERSNARR